MAASVATKLQLKPEMSLTVLNAPAVVGERLRDELADLDRGVPAEPQALLLFVSDLGEVRDLVPDALAAVADGGLVWIAYPKKSSGIETDVDRESLWAAVDAMGWAAVRQIAIDETWSAIRFRPAADVGK